MCGGDSGAPGGDGVCDVRRKETEVRREEESKREGREGERSEGLRERGRERRR